MGCDVVVNFQTLGKLQIVFLNIFIIFSSHLSASFMTKKRSTNKKRSKKCAQASPQQHEVAFNAATSIAKWWKRLKQGAVFTTPNTTRMSQMSIMSTSSIPVFEDDWEKVVAAAELAESMMSPPKIALFEGDWEAVVAAAEMAESAFLSRNLN